MNIKVYNSILDIGETEWSVYVSQRFFLSYHYLLTLERACPQLKYRYTICEENDTFLGLCYFQIIPFSGEMLRDYLPSSKPFYKNVFEKILPFISTDLLVLGNIIFTCENGVLIGNHANDTKNIVYKSFNQVIKTLSSKPFANMISENFDDKSNCKITLKGFNPFRVEDRMEIDLAAFSDFKAYSDALQSKYRVRMNKIYYQNINVEEIEINQDNFEKYASTIENLFLQVLNRSKFKLTQISSTYFYEFLKGVDRFKMKGYIAQDKLVGFVSYFELNTIIEVHYVGLDYNYNQTNKIYNFILYKVLENSFLINKSKICYGRTAQELKSTIGAIPFQNVSSLRLSNSLFNLFLPIALKRILPDEWTIRSPFK